MSAADNSLFRDLRIGAAQAIGGPVLDVAPFANHEFVRLAVTSSPRGAVGDFGVLDLSPIEAHNLAELLDQAVSELPAADAQRLQREGRLRGEGVPQLDPDSRAVAT